MKIVLNTTNIIAKVITAIATIVIVICNVILFKKRKDKINNKNIK